MRAIAVVTIIFLTACTGTPTASIAPPTSAAPSVSQPAATASPTEASPSASAETMLQARPTGESGAPLGYLEYLPTGYADGQPAPLLVFLHGSGEAGDGSEAALGLVEKLGLPQLIADGDWPEDQPFVVLSPQYATEAAESDCATAGDIADFLEFALGHYRVDASRVYLTGISCGAIGIWDYLAVHGNESVASVVPISGHAEWALEKGGCTPLTEVPVWAFHGARDDVVPVVHIEGPMDKIRDCEGATSAEMKLTVYPDADHDAWTRTYDLSAGHDIYAWMLEHEGGTS